MAMEAWSWVACHFFLYLHLTLCTLAMESLNNSVTGLTHPTAHHSCRSSHNHGQGPHPVSSSNDERYLHVVASGSEHPPAVLAHCRAQALKWENTTNRNAIRAQLLLAKEEALKGKFLGHYTVTQEEGQKRRETLPKLPNRRLQPPQEPHSRRHLPDAHLRLVPQEWWTQILPPGSSLPEECQQAMNQPSSRPHGSSTHRIFKSRRGSTSCWPGPTTPPNFPPSATPRNARPLPPGG